MSKKIQRNRQIRNICRLKKNDVKRVDWNSGNSSFHQRKAVKSRTGEKIPHNEIVIVHDDQGRSITLIRENGSMIVISENFRAYLLPL